MWCLSFSQQVDLNGYTLKSSTQIYSSNNSKDCVLEVDIEYFKELHELHDEYSLAPGKIEIKREMFCNYQLKIADLYNIPIGTVKIFLIKKSVCFIMKTCKFV